MTDDFMPDQFRAGRRSRFRITQTAQWALLLPELSDAGYRVYSLMRAHVSTKRDDDLVWPHQKSLAAMLGKRPEAVSRVLNKELIPLGLVDVDVQRYGANNSRRRNLYTVHEEPPPGWRGYASIQEWYAAQQKETAGQPGQAKNRVSGQAKNRVSGDAKDRASNYTKVDLDEGGSAGGSVRPSVRVEDAHASEMDGRTDAAGSRGSEAEARPEAGDGGTARADASLKDSSDRGAVPGEAGPSDADGRRTTPGMEVLTRVGRANEMFQLTGRPFTDQARRIDGVIARSEALGEPWRVSDLVTILSAPLNAPLRKTPGAVISGRIKELPPTPRTAMIPGQDRGEDTADGRETTADSGASDSVGPPLRKHVNCEGQDGTCDRLALPGGTLCALCRDGREARCVDGCGSKVVEPGTRCAACRNVNPAPPALTACPGHGGQPCGRRPQAGGMCGRCRAAAEAARAVRDAEYAAQVAAVTAMTDTERAAAEERMQASAPF